MASRVIYKYQIPIQDHFDLELPYGANICLFATQERCGNHPQLWIEHSATGSSRMVTRKFRVFGTGHPIPDEPLLVHVGSVIAEPFVWHLFEDLEGIEQRVHRKE